MPKKNLILVTGGAGFVGTNLIKLLLKKTNYNIFLYFGYLRNFFPTLILKKLDFLQFIFIML